PDGDLVMELLRRDGECLFLLDRAVEALPILAKARTRAQKLGDRFEEGVILRCLASASAAISEWESMRAYLETGLGILQEINASHELAISHMAAAECLLLQSEQSGEISLPMVLLEDARTHLVSAQHLFKELDLPVWLTRSDAVMKKIAEQQQIDAQYRPESEPARVQHNPGGRIIAASATMRSLVKMCDVIAGYNEPVLITGDTGTGKELIARRIHEQSQRRDKKLVTVNVPAIPQTMFEREFFGHTKGAFSGADQDRPGYAAEADGGTLFLDEIADLPLASQPKLLRLLQEGTYTPIGDPRERKSDVRLLAATNADIKQLVAEGRFRQDLYYRIQVLEVEIPPLRERREDIIPLLNHFLSLIAGRQATAGEYFDAASIQAMKRYAWQGNAREIGMVARRAHIAMTTSGQIRIQLGQGPRMILLSGPGCLTREAAAGGSADDDIMRSRILVALEETDGNKTETARRLGVSRPTLYRWLQRLAISE
ncbi:MAG: sigma-54 dependent transcriptional regulator, partial [bacterium]